jgi:glyceraldehyde-3-phosphate dehydrogenase (NADP+)
MSARIIEVRDPQDGTLIDTVPAATLADLDRALEQATAGADVAAHVSAFERTEILLRAADAVARRGSEHAELIAREGVKTISEARREVSRCVNTLRLSAEEVRQRPGEVIRFDQRRGSEDRIGYWVREPVGVVAAVTPFNDPLNLVAHKVGPAIAAGNAIVVKPHSATPLSALLLARAFDEAGLPAGVLQVVTGHGREIGEALAGDSRVAMVTFTGGREVGLRIARAAAGKRVVLEMGANSPVIVLADADVATAAKLIADGAFAAAGQNCLHVQRVLVHRDVEQEFTDALLAASKQIVVGNKLDERTDMGPLIDEANARRVERTASDAVEQGGRLLCGGHRNGTFLEPTIIAGLPADSDLARNEVFGPATGIVTVDSLSEAIAIANGVDLALHAAIFTRDLGQAMRATRELRAGAVLVNDSTDYRIDAMPFGGTKGSGTGREGVAWAIDEMTAPKVVCFNL